MRANRISLVKVNPIICQDGFQASVQASNFHYCKPQKDNLKEYKSVEIGFPTEYMGDEFIKYCDDIEDPTNTIYSYVPVALVEALVERHGGLKEPCAGS